MSMQYHVSKCHANVEAKNINMQMDTSLISTILMLIDLSDKIRAKFGINNTQIAVHCSDIPEEAPIESQYFFELFDH